MILISPSDVQLKASERHIKAGRSILDLESLKSAVDSFSLYDETIILRNSGAGRLVDRSFLGGRFKPSDVGSFLNKAAEWTFFSPCDKGVKVMPYYPDNRCIMLVLSTLYRVLTAGWERFCLLLQRLCWHWRCLRMGSVPDMRNIWMPTCGW